MTKTILITGATDGIGLETAKRLAADGHTLLLHGRSATKLQSLVETLGGLAEATNLETYQADFSRLGDVAAMADAILAQHSSLDVLINNAGVFETSNPLTPEGDDVRFIVNTVAPYLLVEKLLPMIRKDGRIVNLSSAAQAPVDLNALQNGGQLVAGAAYAQSKLAITMWSMHLSHAIGQHGPTVLAVNPASFLGSKMVKEAYGREGKDLGIGADILVRSAVSGEFEGVTGRYYDNDIGQLTDPHPDALDSNKNAAVVAAIETVIRRLQANKV
ncbi:MAG: SDR family NAD(P)-dependent oxidoreductase [Pseudomonadota bacterium]